MKLPDPRQDLYQHIRQEHYKDPTKVALQCKFAIFNAYVRELFGVDPEERVMRGLVRNARFSLDQIPENHQGELRESAECHKTTFDTGANSANYIGQKCLSKLFPLRIFKTPTPHRVMLGDGHHHVTICREPAPPLPLPRGVALNPRSDRSFSYPSSTGQRASASCQ